MPRVYRSIAAVQHTTPPSVRPSPHIYAFHKQLPGYTPTPLVSLPSVARELGIAHVLLKDESSRFGLPAFKILGASWATCRAVARHLGLPWEQDAVPSLDELSAIVRSKGVSLTLFAATEGNHGRAVARVAQLLGIKCAIYVPRDMPHATRASIASEGAHVVEASGDYDLAVRQSHTAANACDGGLLIQDTAFDNYEEICQWIVDGYSTLLREVDDQVAEVTGRRTPDIVITPIGVGSLGQAVTTHYKQPDREARTRVVTVEPDTASCLRRNLLDRQQADTPETILRSHTIMAGLDCGTVSTVAWPILRDGVDVALSVADIEAHREVENLRAEHVEIGPCGAAPLAALRRLAAETGSDLLKPDSIVVLLATEGARDYHTPLDTTTTDPVTLTQILTQIDSSNPDLSEGAGAGETGIADFLCGWLAHHDFEVHRLEGTPGRPTVVGVARGRGGGRSLILNGHVDTVTLAGYAGDPLSGGIRDGAVHGRGTFDMKAGIAASLVAALRARETQTLRGDIILALVADEENLSIGTIELLAAGWRADAAVVSEPTEHGLMLSHKGFVWADVDILGKAGHGSRPDLCVDAIVKAGHFLVALEKYGQDLIAGRVQGSAVHPKVGTGTVHAGIIKGGEELTSYPALCTVSVERRTVPGETPEVVERQLRAILDHLVETVPDFRYSLRMGESRAPYEIDEGHPFVRLFERHAQQILGHKPTVLAGTYWTDSALLAEKGIPTILFGVQGEGAHAAREFASVRSVGQVTNILTDVATDFCK
ncbi:tryptophan synthase beta subunit-like PLP-dependent enzyme [Fomitopsis serialis]|uniref:tryptophan synthase beta subunit-like PLP-dependent enzyme n=1 Tax=Fomitopsis serialis TaxID=139415 RepID=UPI0020089A8C|nr:tryptophan synthase beta subunit-like PLP-dependent enzyme [Neoantrodia serialis]KAH9918457.1 tryptophan synthase beta subunit-like PLP-dependent enzyme [Neoantrodia serialis]